MTSVILAVLLASAIAGATYLWRLYDRASREAGLAAGMGEAPCLLTRTGGGIVAANAAWRALGESENEPSPADPATRLADAGDLARLETAASKGEAAQAFLKSATDGIGAGRAMLAVAPHPEDSRYVVWRVVDCAAVNQEVLRLADFAGGERTGFYTVDKDGRLLCVDSTLAGWLGAEPQALANQKLHDIVVDPDPADCAPDHPLAGTGPVVSGNVTLRTADGRDFQAVISSARIASADGIGPAARGFVRDASPKVAEIELSEIDVCWKAPFGIAMTDLLGRVIQANPAFCTRAGRDVEEIAGTFMKDLIVDADQEAFGAWHGRVVRKEEAVEPLRAGFRDGEESLLTALRINSVGGASGGIALYASDVAEAMIDPKTIQAQKMELVGQLAGGVAHDFNNLLTAMIGFCDLLLLRHSPKDHSFADIMQIKQNANRAANLVRQLLAFSRQQTLQPRVLDVTDGLAELSHLLRRLIGATVELDMVHGRDLWLVKVDHGQFEQVVINLAVNARDAMGDGGTLTIKTANVPKGDMRIGAYDDLPDADYVSMEVRDTGCGIAPENLEKIFEPFFTTKEVGEGTGLGLSTVYGIVRQTGGHIYVSSVLGAGTTFTIFLPRFESEEDVAGLRADRSVRQRVDTTGTGTVLLVEDEDAVRLFGARALRNKGYEVVEAINGESALEVLENVDKPIDLVITDVVMPGMDGPSLIRRVREVHPDLKVIFISGYTEDAFRRRLDDGAEVHFLPKPFSLQQLAGKVKEVMHEDAKP